MTIVSSFFICHSLLHTDLLIIFVRNLSSAIYPLVLHQHWDQSEMTTHYNPARQLETSNLEFSSGIRPGSTIHPGSITFILAAP